MNRRGSIVRNLSAAVILIVSVTLIVAAAVDHLIGDHYCLELARTTFKLDSESTIDGLEDPLMQRSLEGVEAYFRKVEAENEIYEDLRLIAHESGEVVVALHGGAGTVLGLEDRPCAACHDLVDPALGGLRARDELIEDAGGQELLSAMTPVLMAPSCRTAQCHADVESGAILGFVQADYSLEHLNSSLARRSSSALLVVLCAIVLSAATLALLFVRVLRRPIRRLIKGTRRLAEGDRSFRFQADRNDEIGELERAFNSMTERIAADESNLHEARDYLEGIIENSADIIITVSLDHHIRTFNTGAENVLGYKREEVIGQRMRMLFARPEDRDRALRILENTANVRNFDTQFRTKGGELRDVLLTLSRLRDREGKVIGTFGISKDITEEKKLVRQLIQSNKLIAIGQAVTGIQHATKNMLGSLKGGAYLVRSGLKDGNQERLTEGWEMVEDGIERISSLSKSMLNYAREWKPQLEECDLNELIEGVAESLEQDAGERGIAIRVGHCGDLPMVRADPKLIRTAIMDIASNALDACDLKDFADGETPEVLLKAHLDGDRKNAVIEIGDNGCGMPPEVMKRIFEPFFSTKEQMGTGIGLAMTSRVIEVHGGRCDVDSKIDEGSTFRIVLPVNNT